MKSVLIKLRKGFFITITAGLLAVILALLPVAQLAQAAPVGWARTRTDNIESNIKDSFYLPAPSQAGWSVGSPNYSGGSIYQCWYTPDSGASWVPQAVGNPLSYPALAFSEFESVYFRNPNLGWACGEYGFISRCTNAVGGTWSVVRAGTQNEVLNDIFTTTDAEVWAAGATFTDAADPLTYKPLVIKSINGGLSWETVDISDISFANTTTGWAVGPGGAIICTTNNGLNWNIQPSGTTEDLNAVYAVSSTEAWIGGTGGTILHTTDGGNNWQSDFGTDAVFALDAANVWVGGLDGLIMYYNGTKWALQDSGTSEDIRGIYFADPSYGWAAGTNVTLYTTDGGTTWDPGPALPIASDLNDVRVYHGASDYYIWVCGNSGRLFYTTDADPGGFPAAWSTPTSGPPAQNLRAITFRDENNGIVVGSNGALCASTDGGDTWVEALSTGATNLTDIDYSGTGERWIATAEDGAVWMSSQGTADEWAPMAYNDVSATGSAVPEHYVGNSGMIIERDGGTWTVEDSGVTADLTSVKFYDADVGWAAGRNGVVVCTSDGGATWTSMDTPVPANWEEICVKPSAGSTFLISVVGAGGQIAYTTMENPPIEVVVWNDPATIPVGAPDLNGIDFFNDMIGWAVGESGTVWQTLNGGADWDEVHLNDVTQVSGSDAYFVGDGGTIIHWRPDSTLYEICYNAGGWTTEDLNGIYFDSVSHEGWAVGDNGTVIKCSDGLTPTTWGTAGQVDDPGAGRPDLNAVFMSAADNVYTVGLDGYFARYNGTSWTTPAQVPDPGSGRPELKAVFLSGTDEGYAVGDSGYAVQLTAEDTWQTPAKVGGADPQLNGIWLTAADAGYAVGNNGYYTQLASGTWGAPVQVGGANPDLYDITEPEDVHGWAVGGNGTAGYRVSINAGAFNIPVSMGAGTRDLTGVCMATGATDVAFASGMYRTIASYNVTGGGWVVDAEVPSTAGDFNAISLTDALARGWIAGDGGMMYQAYGGVFNSRSSGTTNNINDVSTAGLSEATAAASGSVVLVYNGSWNGFTMPSGQDYYGCVGLAGGYSTVVGAMNNVLNTTGGGWVAESVFYKTTDDVKSVDCVDSNNAWFCGQAGMIYRIENGRFLQVSSNVSTDLESVSMYGLFSGFAAGANRVVLEDTPGGGWETRSQFNSGLRVNGISFPQPGNGWFAGARDSSGNTVGYVMAYDNGSFVEQDVGAMTKEFNDVSFIDGGAGLYSGICVGVEGTVWRTDDSGAGWAAGLGQPGADLNGVDLINATDAVLVGDYSGGATVSYTTNAGYTWDPASITLAPSTTPDFMGVAFGDPVNDSGWIVGTDGALYRSDSPDPGQNWTVMSSTTGEDLNAIDAQYDGGSSDYLLFAGGDARTIIRSWNGGNNWQTQSTIPAAGVINAGAAADPSTIYLCGAHTSIAAGMMSKTLDGGATFVREYDGGILPLYGISIADAAHIWVTGHSGPATSTVMYWNGAVWNFQASLAGTTLPRDISVQSDGIGGYNGVLAGAGGSAYYSINAATDSWTAATVNANKNDLYTCNFEYGAGPGTANYGGDAGTLLSSADGGDTLAFMRGPANTLYSTSFYDETNGWACGTQGTILQTTDAGNTWVPQDSGTTNDLFGIFAVASNNAWAVGKAGTALFWDGATWTSSDTGATNDYYGVFADPTHAWVVGDDGAIKYHDAIWNSQDFSTANLRGIAVADATHIWAVGSSGAVLFSDGGTWSAQTSGTAADLNSVTAPDKDHAWACGTSGIMIKSTDMSANWSSMTAAPADLNGVTFVDAVNGFAVGVPDVGTNPAIAIRSTDGGLTWTEQSSDTGPTRTLYGIDGEFDAGTNNYTMYAVGDWGLAQKQVNSTALPQITPPVSPGAGPTGTTVTIDGTNFGADKAAAGGHVYFNDTIEGATTAWSDMQITVTVPDDAYGLNKDLRVVTNGGGSNAVPFTTDVAVDSASSPISGGDSCTIAGSGFGPDPGAGQRGSIQSHVSIEGTWIDTADVTAWTNSYITFTCPNTIAPKHDASLQVDRGGCSSAILIDVAPKITNISSTHGRPGSSVTLTGVNFGTDPTAGWGADDCLKMQEMDMAGAVSSQPMPVDSIISWNNTSIVFTVPAEAFRSWSGAVSVRRGAAESAAGTTYDVEPLVTAPGTASGTVGSVATIPGWAFGAPQGSSRIYFNGVEGTAVTQWLYDEIQVTIPETASGHVTVTTANGSSNSDVEFSILPSVTALSVSSGRAGDTVTITGTGFGAAKGESTVTFDGAGAATTAWGANSITATVPNDASTGDVQVTTAGGTSAAVPADLFTVLPKITRISPTNLVPGTTLVTISGYNFGTPQTESKVEFNGVVGGTATSWSNTQIKITAPADCVTGTIVVTTGDGASNAYDYTVGPQITSVSPTQGAPTGEVTVAGSNFKDTQSDSKVKFNGVDAGTAVSWSDQSIKVKVPYGASTGPVTVTTMEGTSNAVTFEVGLSKVYYFAEGTTRANFQEWLCLMNPNTRDATVNITYMKGDGTTQPQQLVVKPNSRSTVYVPDAIGLDQDVSTKVEANVPIMAERPMYFNYGGVWDGGHDVVGAIAPAPDWYFAEGNTRDGFEEWLCLQNPGTAKATVEITYMLSGGETKVQDVVIPGTSRQTIDVKGFLGANKDCSAVVHSDVGIIAERPMYFVYQPETKKWTGGHDVIGANAPGKEWYFAEGTTRDGFDEWLCLQNPGDVTASANVYYMLSSGQQLTQVVQVTPKSRKTVDVAAFVGRGADLSVHVSSDQPIVAERPMYFDYVGLTGGSDVIGATCSSPNWYFAEGATQGGFQEWLSVQNPGNADITIRVTYMLGQGDPITRDVIVGAHARATIDVNSDVGPGKDVSTKIVALSGTVIIERPMYFNLHGWTGGHDVVGFHY